MVGLQAAPVAPNEVNADSDVFTVLMWYSFAEVHL
jgi:hypothetical protein